MVDVVVLVMGFGLGFVVRACGDGGGGGGAVEIPAVLRIGFGDSWWGVGLRRGRYVVCRHPCFCVLVANT